MERSIIQEALVSTKGEIASHAAQKVKALSSADLKEGVRYFFDDVLVQLARVIDHLYGDTLVMKAVALRPDVKALQISPKDQEDKPVVDLMIMPFDTGDALLITTYERMGETDLIPKKPIAYFQQTGRLIKALRLTSGESVSASEAVGTFISYVVERLPRVPEGGKLPPEMQSASPGLRYV